MTYVLTIAGSLMLATAGSYAGNRTLYRTLGYSTALAVAPLWEEMCKTVAIALIPGTPIFFVHIVFGCMESLYNLLQSLHSGLLLAVLSFTTHAMIGAASTMVLIYWNNLWWACGTAALVHLTLNGLFMRLVLPTLAGMTTSE